MGIEIEGGLAMCDCYSHTCELCNETVEMHIANFQNKREELRVWCKSHIKHAPDTATIFVVTRGNFEYRRGWACAIDGPNVGDNGGGKTPNIATTMLEIKRKDWKGFGRILGKKSAAR
jgi:hypothetical protein